MKIVDIELSDPFDDMAAGTSVAQVTFHTDQMRQAHFTCLLRSDEIAPHPESKRRLLFVHDALRQLKKMPEFRSGGEAVTFARRIVGWPGGVTA